MDCKKEIKLARTQGGATMVEYAIMVALIAIVAISAVKLLGTNTSSTFNRAATSMAGVG